ncbi:MAG: hypothetical protein ACE5KC_00865 [Candidatus Bathyarchaeia archaeon]
MKQAIRALSWATTILWILVILFSGTVVYSAVQMAQAGGIEPGEPTATVSNGTVVTSVPFTIDNVGFYDISDFEITTHITDENGTAISSSTTPPSSIPKGSEATITHSISINLNEISADTLTYMLTNDTVLNIDMLVALTYAHVIPLKISFNTTMSWGAPLYNLTVGGITIVSPKQVDVSLSFENHAFFSFNGTISLEIWDSAGVIGSGTTYIPVQPGNRYDLSIPVTITGNPMDAVEVHLQIDTSLFSFGPMVIAV